MGLQEAYIMLATLLLTTSKHVIQPAVIQATVDLGGDNKEILQMIFRQIELLGNKHNNNTSLSQGHTDLATTLLQTAPVVIIKGNITDEARRLTVTFMVQASKDRSLLHSSSSEEDDDDVDEDDLDFDWRGSGGVFHPIVGVVEPYVLSFAEILFNGILSSIISNFLEGSNLLGDVRLV